MILLRELQLPEAWKPVFRALDDHGWVPREQIDILPDWTDLPILQLTNESQKVCYLSFFREPLWCGNAYQSGGLSIAGLSWEFPRERPLAEVHSLLLATDWENGLETWIRGFSLSERET